MGLSETGGVGMPMDAPTYGFRENGGDLEIKRIIDTTV
jgi:hypothetical protein